MRSHSGKEKKTGKVHSPVLSHTNFSLRAGQINQLILLVDAQFLGMVKSASLLRGRAVTQVLSHLCLTAIGGTCLFPRINTQAVTCAHWTR